MKKAKMLWLFKACVLFLCIILFGRDVSLSQSEPELKEKLIKKHPVKETWKRLELVRIFPSPHDEKRGHYFLRPSCLEIDNFLYVVDSNLHKILKFDTKGNFLEAIGRKGEGPGEFTFPNIVKLSESGNIITFEGGSLRIQILNQEGKCIKTFRTLYPIHDLSVTNNKIYANFLYRNEENENPLIVILDMDGKIVGSFGKRIDQKGHRTFDSSVFLKSYGNGIVAVFRYYPIVRMYTFDGRLEKEFRINMDLLNKLEKYNYDKEYTSPNPYTIRLVRLISGVGVTDKSIFILLHLPRLEILEVDMEGNQKNYYYSDSLKDVINYGGFSIKKSGDILLFYILQTYEEPKMFLFQNKTPNERREQLWQK
jgi:hypothetical protein